MTIYTQLLTFTTAPVQLTNPNANFPFMAVRVHAEALATNTHAMYTGTSALTTGAGSSGVNVIHSHIVPSATVPADAFDEEDHAGQNRLDLSQYAWDGTSGEKVKVTFWVA